MIKSIDEKLFESYLVWCKSHKFSPFPYEALKHRAKFVFVDNKPILFFHLFFDSLCKSGFLGPIVRDPASDDKSVDLSIKLMAEWIRSNHSDLIFILTSTIIKKLSTRLQNNGFVECDKNVTHLFLNPRKDL